MINTYTFINLSDLGDIIISSNNSNESSSFELLSLIPVQRRHHHLLDVSIENEDDTGNENEEYFDFRNYPLNINWADVNNSDNYSCIIIYYSFLSF